MMKLVKKLKCWECRNRTKKENERGYLYDFCKKHGKFIFGRFPDPVMIEEEQCFERRGKIETSQTQPEKF